MSESIKIYRVASYDGARRSVTAELIKAASDHDAIGKVRAASFGTQCEIWDGARLVAELGIDRARA